jgi:hypothetical protein
MRENLKTCVSEVSVSVGTIFDERGEAEGKRKICHEPCPQQAVINPKITIEVGSMEKEMADNGKMYFEDLPKHVQDLLLDLIVSIVRNTKAEEAGLVPNAAPGTKGRKRKGFPRKNRAPSR